MLPQEQAIEGGAIDEEDELAQGLVAHAGSQPVVVQSGTERAQALQQLGQGVGRG